MVIKCGTIATIIFLLSAQQCCHAIQAGEKLGDIPQSPRPTSSLLVEETPVTTEYARLYQEITRRIVAAANPVKVILFGSRARGMAHPGSDLDLLIIEHDPVSARQEAIRLRRLLRDLEIPVDIIVVGQSFAERYGDIPGSVLYPAFREGMVLYG